MSSLSVVIVNWNSGEQLAECLASISGAVTDSIGLELVVVVDNASVDGSMDRIASPQLPLRVLRNPVNRGFAAACNQGASLANADYLLFLNPDVRLFPGALRLPIAHLERRENARVGICGIQLVDRHERVLRSCARFPSPGTLLAAMTGLDRLLPRRLPPSRMTEWDHGASADVDQIMGAFFLVRGSMFRALGGFDERFFVYYEDVDLSLRASQAGWISRYLVGARAFHRGEGTTDQIRARRLFFSLRSRVLYAFKHFTPISAVTVLVATLIVEPVSRCALSLRRRSWRGLRETVGGFLALWRDLPSIAHIVGAYRKDMTR